MRVKAIFGSPGTGKTRTMVSAAKHGMNNLFLSFTKAAALEVTSRISGNNVKASTIHSLAFSELGLSRASVVDRVKLKQFGLEAGIPFKGSEPDSDQIEEGDVYSSMLSYANNTLVDPLSVYDRFGRPGTQHRYEIFLESYSKWKSVYGFLDFDDMLTEHTKHRTTPLPWRYIFLDEAQDCSPLQWKTFNAMCRKDAIVTVAADDDQAIYSWSGADPHGVSKFVGQHDGQSVVLEQSHRMPDCVHALVHEYILPQIIQRVDKKFRPTGRAGMIQRYGDFSNVDLQSFYNAGGGMILARDRYRLDEIRRTLNRDMIPYNMLGGHSPWTSKLANSMRKGDSVDWTGSNAKWREFYNQADLNLPVNINLSTIHQSKGREAERVILDLSMPARVLENMYLDMDAELRIMYVGLTRASEELILCGSNSII